VTVNSYVTTFVEMDQIQRALRDAFGDPMTNGAVVTPGADTREGTAALLALNLHDDRSVVLPGALRPRDDPE
jgi:L-asparaginase/Glu-tRNA(Gln) amidotransferase subunit D